MVFSANRGGISHCRQRIKEGLWKMDHQLTANEEGIRRMLQSLMEGSVKFYCDLTKIL